MKTPVRVLALTLLLCAASVLSSAQPAAVPDSVQRRNDQYLADLRQAISGKDDQPAGEVFQNVQMMKQVPAGRFLDIMNGGFSRSLGVTCAHCHVPGEWQKDDKPPKDIARSMSKMLGTINNDLLAGIKNLRDPGARIGCFTCHRGEVKPAGMMMMGRR